MSESSNESKSIWVNEFTSIDLKDFYNKFAELENDRLVDIIPVFIDSFGGSAFSLLAMRDIIKASSKPVATICLGKAMSAGALLLAAGTRGYRFVSPDSQIMIHEVGSATFGKYTDMAADLENTKKLDKKIFENLAQDTGINVKRFLDEMHKRGNADWYLAASDAKKWGLVDFISVPKIVNREAISQFLKVKP